MRAPLLAMLVMIYVLPYGGAEETLPVLAEGEGPMPGYVAFAVEVYGPAFRYEVWVRNASGTFALIDGAASESGGATSVWIGGTRGLAEVHGLGRHVVVPAPDALDGDWWMDGAYESYCEPWACPAVQRFHVVIGMAGESARWGYRILGEGRIAERTTGDTSYVGSTRSMEGRHAATWAGGVEAALALDARADIEARGRLVGAFGGDVGAGVLRAVTPAGSFACDCFWTMGESLPSPPGRYALEQEGPAAAEAYYAFLDVEWPAHESDAT